MLLWLGLYQTHFSFISLLSVRFLPTGGARGSLEGRKWEKGLDPFSFASSFCKGLPSNCSSFSKKQLLHFLVSSSSLRTSLRCTTSEISVPAEQHTLLRGLSYSSSSELLRYQHQWEAPLERQESQAIRNPSSGLLGSDNPNIFALSPQP